jgi:disulfide bond formation protein DsbB
MNDRIFRHILLPAFAPILFLVIATTPVDVLGCRNRGLLAIAIAFLSILAGLGLAVAGVRWKMQGRPDANWWATSALVLAIPAVLLILFA